MALIAEDEVESLTFKSLGGAVHDRKHFTREGEAVDHRADTQVAVLRILATLTYYRPANRSAVTLDYQSRQVCFLTWIQNLQSLPVSHSRERANLPCPFPEILHTFVGLVIKLCDLKG